MTCSVPVAGLVYVFWESVFPSIVNRRDKHSLDCFLLFFNSESGLILCIGHRNSIHPYPLGSCGPFKENDACNFLIIIHETGPGIKLATFGLVDEFSPKEGNLLLTRTQPLR